MILYLQLRQTEVMQPGGVGSVILLHSPDHEVDLTGRWIVAQEKHGCIGWVFGVGISDVAVEGLHVGELARGHPGEEVLHVTELQ